MLPDLMYLNSKLRVHMVDRLRNLIYFRTQVDYIMATLKVLHITRSDKRGGRVRLSLTADRSGRGNLLIRARISLSLALHLILPTDSSRKTSNKLKSRISNDVSSSTAFLEPHLECPAALLKVGMLGKLGVRGAKLPTL